MRWTLLFVSTVLILLIPGCKLPVASFVFSPDPVEVGDTVYFQSTSQNAISFDWDFGDGSGSTGENHTHIYQTEGDFSVALVAYNQNGSDKTTNTVSVIQSSP